MSISVVCRQCNKTYRVKDELAGKRGKCPQGHVLVLPELDADASPFAFSAPEPWPAEGAKSISDPPSPKGKEQVPAPAGKSCPSCRANMSAKGVICVACGFDIRTGKKVASVAASETGSQRTALIAGIGAGALIVVAIVVSLLVLRGGPLTFQVKSLKTQKSYDYSDYRGNASITAKADDTLLVVNLSVQNGGKAWETFSSPSFRILDEAGKPVDATFLGFDNTICTSGSMAMNDWSSISVGGDTVLRFKGRLDSNEPKNSHIDFEVAPGKSYTQTFVFVIPDQTQGPRFELAKK